MKDADTSSKLVKIDLASSDNLMTYKHVYIGEGAVKWLVNSKPSDLVKMDFVMQSITFMKTAAAKIIEQVR